MALFSHQRHSSQVFLGFILLLVFKGKLENFNSFIDLINWVFLQLENSNTKLMKLIQIALFFMQRFQGLHLPSRTSAITQCGQEFWEHQPLEPQDLSSQREAPEPSRLRQVGPAGSGPEPTANSTVRAAEPVPPQTAAPARSTATAPELRRRQPSPSSRSAPVPWTTTT